MQLNLPIFEQLNRCQNLLIAGMGGGFDIFCGLPIYFELRRQGKTVHLANFSFSDIANVPRGDRLSDTLVGVTADADDPLLYFPELYLSQWFQSTRQESIPIWCFHKTGTQALLENYRILVEHLAIDGILLIDGGVDSLIFGDETELGTPIEDAISLFVLNELSHINPRILGCLGFGAERDISYAHVLENIARLTQVGGFLGSCSLTPQMQVYQDYESAVLSVQGQIGQDSSVINSSVISAVQGQYGDYHLTEKTHGSRLWISPLMPLYWFFEAQIVAHHNLYLSELRDTQTFRDAIYAYINIAKQFSRRSPHHIPLT